MNKTLELFDNLKELLKNRFIMSEWAIASLAIIEKELEAYEKYKNIEEELGIDLVTLFKDLKEGKITELEYINGEWYCYDPYLEISKPLVNMKEELE